MTTKIKLCHNNHQVCYPGYHSVCSSRRWRHLGRVGVMVWMLSPVLLSEGGRQKKVKKRGEWRKVKHTHSNYCPHQKPCSFSDQVEVLWQPCTSGFRRRLWRWNRLFNDFNLKLSLILPYCPGIGGHWDAEHCQGDGEGGPGDCGSDRILHKFFIQLNLKT